MPQSQDNRQQNLVVIIIHQRLVVVLSPIQSMVLNCKYIPVSKKDFKLYYDRSILTDRYIHYAKYRNGKQAKEDNMERELH